MNYAGCKRKFDVATYVRKMSKYMSADQKVSRGLLFFFFGLNCTLRGSDAGRRNQEAKRAAREESAEG